MDIHRTRIGKDIVAEFAVPERKSNKIAVIASGMPSTPTKRTLVAFLAKQGFYVVYPRYRGTWESRGAFLKDEPTKDILDVMNYLKKYKKLESLWEEKTYHFPAKPKFYLFGGSFGGPASILLSKNPDVAKVVCVAPVVDWNMESRAEPLPWLFNLVQNAYGEGFRMSKKDWQKLGETPFYDPVQQSEKIDGSKILIFHARDDESVPVEDVIVFAKRHRIKTHIRKSGEHLSLSEVARPFYWNRIETFFN